MDLTFQVPMLFIASDFTSITSHIHNWVLFVLWLYLFILSRVISPLFSGSLRKQTFRGHKRNLVWHQNPVKEAVILQETGPDLLMSAKESPVELRVSSDLLQGWWH